VAENGGPDTCVVAGERIARYGFPDGHPFGPDRHDAFWRELVSQGLDKRVQQLAPRTATRAELELFHDPGYVEFVIARSATGEGLLDAGDTPAFKGVYEAASDVVGASLVAAEAVMTGRARRGFVPIRGLHHAGRAHAAGFCVFNDIGVVVEHLKHRHGLSRIAYVDIDAHHGDGVFYAYEDDPVVIVADTHEDGRFLYPGTGAASEIGSGKAAGSKLNLPLPPGAGDTEFLAAWPAIEAHVDRYASRVRDLPVRCRQPGRRPDHPPPADRGCARTRGTTVVRGCGPPRFGPHPRIRRRRIQPAQHRASLDPRRRGLRGSGLIGVFRVDFALVSALAAGESMFEPGMSIESFDPDVAGAIDAERRRQEDHLELIASENYTSPRVLEAQGSVLTNKYAEGYPGKRYYGGCENVDVVEELAIERAKAAVRRIICERAAALRLAGERRSLFRAHEPGDTFLGMSLDHGGHLTHGAKVNFSGKFFNAIQYGLDPATGEIDYAGVERLAREHRPKMILADSPRIRA
jgi:acetoin utilization protein AcuC